MDRYTLRAFEATAVTEMLLELCAAASSDDVRLAALAQAVLRMCNKLGVPVELFIARLRTGEN